MKQTDNLKMNLPEYTDAVDIEQLNDNFKTLDTQVSAKLSKPANDAVATAGQVLTKTADGSEWKDAPDGEPFVVTVTGDSDGYTADKSFAEIKAAFDAKRPCFAIVDGSLYLYPVRATINVIRFMAVMDNDVCMMAIADDGDNTVVELVDTMMQAISYVSGLLKGDGEGNITSAIAGSDYVTPESVNTAIEAVKVTVDSAMSSTSENPVQNKVVAAAIDSAIQSAIQNTWEASY